MQTFEDFWGSITDYGLENIHTFRVLKRLFPYANGCGAKGGIHVPHTFYGLSIEAACNMHDVDWTAAKSVFDLVDANQRFRRNMEKIITQKSANRFMIYIRMLRMTKYYTMVKLVGTNDYKKERGFI